jgi:beta-glucanase (GH16 family)
MQWFVPRSCSSLLVLASRWNWRCICLFAALSLPLLGGELQKEKTSEGYILVWSDEFSGRDGSLPDASKWTYDIGGSGWGNHELEYYTNRRENARVEDGKLVITARREEYTGPDGAKFNYTSARLKTQGLFSQVYGRFEARIKLPAGQGTWPAFWALGDNFASVGWPRCGEIDIMENVGKEPGINHGSLHGPSSAGATSDLTATIMLPAGQKLSDDFHIYAAEWEPGTIRFYLDANLYATFTSAEWPAGGTWVFDQRFFLILNVAVGGDWPGSPDTTTTFPQTMLVDYVRVYKRKT